MLAFVPGKTAAHVPAAAKPHEATHTHAHTAVKAAAPVAAAALAPPSQLGAECWDLLTFGVFSVLLQIQLSESRFAQPVPVTVGVMVARPNRSACVWGFHNG